jgi:protein-L-isoaspartate(D-aspartate) O-methyltransferase
LLGRFVAFRAGAGDGARTPEDGDEVATMARSVGMGTIDPRVLAALDRVPRHDFVSPLLRFNAYDNRPLPIGFAARQFPQSGKAKVTQKKSHQS